VRWDYENVLKISMLYHARLNVEYTKIMCTFQNEKETVLENFATTIGCYWINVSGDKASTLLGTPATSAVIAIIRIRIADYIDDYYQILYPPVLEQMKLLF
jgi:lipopolysaccharide biosynthesis glycosyltransferase